MINIGTSSSNIEISSPSSNLLAVDSTGNRVFEQTSTGSVLAPKTAAGNLTTPLFKVGMPGSSWQNYTQYPVGFTFTGGSGYMNVNSCYNTSTSRFTAVLEGFYLFKQHGYMYGNNGTTSWYLHPDFFINGSRGGRRVSTPHRMRLYGLYANNAQDTDACEILYLYPGDYVEVGWSTSGTLQTHSSYNDFSGVYIGI